MWSTGPSAGARVWQLVAEQHGVISHAQLIALGYSARAIEHRLARGRLHRLFRGIYVVGRPEATQEGRWMGAVLACGDGAAVSHGDAAALWAMARRSPGPIHVSVPRASRSRRREIRVHRRSALSPREITRRRRIPVTAPATTIVDIAALTPVSRVERAINEADQLGVIGFDALLRELDRMSARPGLGKVKALVLRHTFRLTRSELERLFLPITRAAGLPTPQTRAVVCGFEVDFWWPSLGLIVETDSLAYHRTPAKQLRDRLRDQAHLAADLTPLRFTHWQVEHERRYVEQRLRQVGARLAQRHAAARATTTPRRP